MVLAAKGEPRGRPPFLAGGAELWIDSQCLLQFGPTKGLLSSFILAQVPASLSRSSCIGEDPYMPEWRQTVG